MLCSARNEGSKELQSPSTHDLACSEFAGICVTLKHVVPYLKGDRRSRESSDILNRGLLNLVLQKAILVQKIVRIPIGEVAKKLDQNSSGFDFQFEHFGIMSVSKRLFESFLSFLSGDTSTLPYWLGGSSFGVYGSG